MIENVDFSFVASSNKVVLTLDPAYFARVEGVTLSLSAKDIRDMRNNKSNVEKWTAFVRRNALQWGTEPVYISMEEGESRNFTARISNSGGTTVSYSVENLPSWLSITNGVGNLAPLASRDLTFTVVPGVNIGSYEAAIGLTSGNGVVEALGAQLKVSGAHPGWKVDPNSFEGFMTITGQIKINDVFSENTENILAAFIGDKCVGTASLTYVSPSNAFFVFSSIHGNTGDNGEPVTFKLWDASTGRIFPKVDVSDAVTFSPGTILGSPASPVIFNALDTYEQIITLRSGWNWVSSNILSDNPAVLEQVKTSLGTAGVMVKGKDDFIQRSPLTWLGKLDNISETSMYLVNVNRDVSLSIQGSLADPATSSISIDKGWNWIGYIPQFSLPVQNALAGINARSGDIVKDQNSYAIYLGNGIWAGTLTFMRPGDGYMYHSGSDAVQTLVYPSQSSQTQHAMAAPPAEPHWTVNTNAYSNTMTITAIVMEDGEELANDQLEIAAFSGTECRGSVLMQYVPSIDKVVAFLTVYGDGGEDMKLKVYNHETEEEYTVNNTALTFSANAMHGMPDFYIVDVELDATPIRVPQLAGANGVRAIHNGINLTAQNNAVIEVYNLNGKQVYWQQFGGGAYSVPLGHLPKGIYVVKAQFGSEQKIVQVPVID
jgi:hypothetical protein